MYSNKYSKSTIRIISIIKFKSFSESKDAEVELLYGTAGYLYTLLFLKKYIDSFGQNDEINDIIAENMKNLLNETIIKIFDILIILYI